MVKSTKGRQRFRQLEDNMTEELQRLIDSAKERPFPPAEREAQRRSFAYGNTKIENDLITREMVAEQDELLKRELLAR